MQKAKSGKNQKEISGIAMKCSKHDISKQAMTVIVVAADHLSVVVLALTVVIAVVGHFARPKQCPEEQA